MRTLPAPTAWSFDPIAICGLVALLALYLLAIGPLRRQRAAATPLSTVRVASYLSGWLLLALTLLSPLDTLGRYYLFSAHTVQLFIEITLVTPLLLFGLPEWLVTFLLPTHALRELTRGLLFIIGAAFAFNAIILIWHIGPFYDAALRNPLAHNLQTFSFLVAGILTWWPLLTPLDRHTRMATPVQMLYLMLESVPLDVFGAAALFTPYAFYPVYEHAPRLFGLSALGDQQFAGAILAVPGNIIDIVLMSVIFFVWMGKVERAQKERDRLQYGDDDAALAADPPVEASAASEGSR